MNRSEASCQPCNNFEPVVNETFPLGKVHECYRSNVTESSEQDFRPCSLLVYSCMNCGGDHHDGGWQTCQAVRSSLAIVCKHPLCVARRGHAEPICDRCRRPFNQVASGLGAFFCRPCEHAVAVFCGRISAASAPNTLTGTDWVFMVLKLMGISGPGAPHWPSARQAARDRQPLGGADAQALEHALTITERERDVARALVDDRSLATILAEGRD